jgi:hypothetical protein
MASYSYSCGKHDNVRHNYLAGVVLKEQGYFSTWLKIEAVMKILKYNSILYVSLIQ